MIFEKQLRNVVKLVEMQGRFMPGCGTVAAIFILWQIVEKYKTTRRKMYVVFVDLEKAFDPVPRKIGRHYGEKM